MKFKRIAKIEFEENSLTLKYSFTQWIIHFVGK